MNPLRTYPKSLFLVAAVVGLTSAPVAAQSDRAGRPAETRIASGPFRAERPIGDARYSADGKRIVGYAGSTLYVWDATDGSLVRKTDTKLDLLNDHTKHDKLELAFAVHPKESRVACGGVKDGKTYLQVWDFETGKLIAERASRCDALKVLAWTPDGTRLLERANVGWEKPTGWKLIVRNEKLAEVRAHDLPKDFGEWSTIVRPGPGGKEVILWQSQRQPTVFNLETGAAVRTIAHQPNIPSDLGLSPDGKTLIATDTDGMCLIDLPKGEVTRRLPVLRGGWEKPRPLFSPDGMTVYVWDHRPIAYDVATGTEKWKATFRTVHTVRMRLCDVSPDGATVLARHGHGLTRIDAKTGTERDPPDGPSAPPGVVWSPDGRMLFTRATNHDRTWTAWDAATGKRLYDLQPTGFVTDDDWKMLELFFIAGGKEIVVGLEKAESTEKVGPKEFLVFDPTTGQCKRRLGAPLPDETFRWMHPIAMDPAGIEVLMQAFAINAGAPDQYAAIRWDTVKGTKVREWSVDGGRNGPPRHYAPHVVTLGVTHLDPSIRGKKIDPAKVRIYSPVDGKLVHELTTEFAGIDTDRLQGNFLLTVGYESTWVTRGNSMRYTPQAPIAYDLWELPARDKVRVFDLEAQTAVVLGPGGRYVLRVLDDRTVEVHEPFVLKKAVAKVATPCRPQSFEFSPDGGRVAVSFADASVVIWDTAPWRARIAEQVAGQVPTNLSPLWEDLAKDAATGLRAARLLSAAGDKAVSLLVEKMAARKAPDEARIQQWIADLDSPRFAAREKAEKDLRDLAGQAEPHLRRELRATPSAEVKRRVTSLLADIDAGKPTPVQNREQRAVQALEWMDTATAQALLAKWAVGDPNAALTRAAAKAVRR